MTRRLRTVALITCTREKRRGGAVPARRLYTNRQFRAILARAERLHDAAFIVSARHGLVEPDQPLRWYDRRLDAYPEAGRKAWGGFVAACLACAGAGRGTTAHLHMTRLYARYLRGPLRRLGCRLVFHDFDGPDWLGDGAR